MNPVEVSRELLLGLKKKEEVEEVENRLKEFDEEELRPALEDDDAKKAFWINVYNAYGQLLLEREPDLYDSRRKFFGSEKIEVTDRKLSLDFVEHRLLRRSQTKLGLGYIRVPRIFVGSFEKGFRLDERDYRIHFALNCGSKSCPPIATYSDENLDEELNTATKSYLSQEVEYESGVARVPRHFLWYRGDFGGKNGTLKILREFDIVPADAKPKIKYKSYNWEMEKEKYAETF